MTDPIAPEPLDPIEALQAAYKRGWASAEIAAYLGVSPVTVRAWRRKFRSPCPESAAKIHALPEKPVETDKFYLKR